MTVIRKEFNAEAAAAYKFDFKKEAELFYAQNPECSDRVEFYTD